MQEILSHGQEFKESFEFAITNQFYDGDRMTRKKQKNFQLTFESFYIKSRAGRIMIRYKVYVMSSTQELV